MKRFLISSAKYPGNIEMSFDQTGKLFKVDFSNATLSEPQIKNFLSFVPAHYTQLAEAFKGTAGILVEVGFEYTFEDFWSKYNLKRNKKPAEKIWAKLSATDKYKAVSNVDAYDRYRKRKPWLEKMYPDTYLRNEHFNDEWDKLN